METAKKLSPNFWLVKQLEGSRLTSDAYGKRQREKWKSGLTLLKEATRLAPNLAITWNRYGKALSYAATDKYVWNGHLVTQIDAVTAYEKAVRVDPARGSWLDLFREYHFNVVDPKNALRCKREFLTRWPKNRPLDPVYKAWFAKYPA